MVGARQSVGTTTLAVNAAVALADQALRVVLVDANLYRGTIAQRCGLPERGHIGDILAARRDIHEVLERGPGGVLVVPGIAIPDAEIPATSPPFSRRAYQRLWKQIRSLGRHADVVLLDAGTAGALTVPQMGAACNQTILITTASSTSIMDCYATIKTARIPNCETDSIGLIVNRVAADADGKAVFDRIDQSARRFLNRPVAWLGSVQEDGALLRTGGPQRPAVLESPQAAGSAAIRQIAHSFAEGPESTRSAAA